MELRIFLLLFAPIFILKVGAKNIGLVITQSGKVQGTSETSFESREYWSFRGIPYAEPPLGQLRFKVMAHFG
jgi:hypothetical protein